MARKTGWVRASGYLFLLGVIIAVIAGLARDIMIGYEVSIHSILVILGFIIGLLGAAGVGSIERGQSQTFMLAVIALVAAGASGGVLADIPTIGVYLAGIVGYIAALVLPAAVLISLEAIWKAGATRF
jgi:hypothetical protein